MKNIIDKIMDNKIVENIYIGMGIAALIVIINIIFFAERTEDIQLHQIERRIYSLKEDNRISRFSLLMGKIDDKDYYFFYSENTKFGGFVKEKIPADETILIEKDTIPTVIRQYVVRKKMMKSNWFPFFNNTKTDTLDLDVYNHFILAKDKINEYNYKLIVPKGTITEKQVYLEKNSNPIPYEFNNVDEKNEKVNNKK